MLKFVNRLMRGVLLLVSILFMAGCASTNVQRLGNYDYPALADSEKVAVFLNISEVSVPYKTLASLSHDDPGKYQRLTLEDAIIPLQTKAREVGANAIVVDYHCPIYSGIISRGIHAQARAIRLD